MSKTRVYFGKKSDKAIEVDEELSTEWVTHVIGKARGDGQTIYTTLPDEFDDVDKIKTALLNFFDENLLLRLAGEPFWQGMFMGFVWCIYELKQDLEDEDDGYEIESF